MKRALVLAAACWTGPDAPVEPLANQTQPQAEQPHGDLDIAMERTACFGSCPEYSVEIHRDGSVVWHGVTNVATTGTARGRASAAQLRQLARAVDATHFFELDENGHLPQKPECVRTGNTVTCSLQSITFCSDTPHAIITIRRGTETHTVDDAHCGDNTALEHLEELIDRVAGAHARIGR